MASTPIRSRRSLASSSRDCNGPPPSDNWIATTGDWNTGSDWSLGAPPGLDSDATIGSTGDPSISNETVTLDGVTVTMQSGGEIDIGADGTVILVDAAQIDGGALLFDDGTGTVNVDAGSDGTGAVLDGVDVIGHSGDAIQVVDGVDLTLSGGTFIGNAALSIDASSMVEITGVLGAVFAGVNVVDDNMLQVDTGSTLVLGGGSDISGDGQIANLGTVSIDGSVLIGSQISFSGGTIALTSEAELTLGDVQASNTTIDAGSFVSLADPAANVAYGLQAVAINSAGDLVGTYVDANFVDRSFLYSNGVYTSIDDPSAPLPTSPTQSLNGTVATSINDSGQIAGYYYGGDGGVHGFIATDPETGYTYVTIDDPNAVNTFVTSIDTAGDVAGYYQATAGGSYAAFLYDNSTSTFTDLTGPSGGFGIDSGPVGGTGDAGGPILLNDNGQVAGTYIGASGDGVGAYGFVYSNASASYAVISDPNAIIADGFGTVIEGVNDSGAVVGYYRSDIDGVDHGFVATPDIDGGYNYIDLNDPTANGGVTYGLAISDTGEVVGYYLDNNGDQHPFLYANGAYYDLTGTGEALAINGANQIVGWDDFGNSQDGFVGNSVADATLQLSGGTTIENSTLTLGGTDILDVETGSGAAAKLDNIAVSNGNEIEVGATTTQSDLLLTDGTAVTGGTLVVDIGSEFEIQNGTDGGVTLDGVRRNERWSRSD